jgi:hemerythrin superfamily protein
MTTPLASPSPAVHNAGSIANQDEQALGGPSSLLARQRRDHAELDRLLDALAVQPEDDALLNRLARLVFPHAYAEETVVWPVLRATLPDGEQLTLRNEQEHQRINALWAQMERDRRPDLLTEITALLRQDARDEEDLLLPRLQHALSPAQLRRLGRTWEAVRRVAPTRPHAVVSRRPPGNLLSALPLTVLDRSRDGLDAGARAVPLVAPALTAASRALAGVAGAVEHLPPLRRGERAETRV